MVCTPAGGATAVFGILCLVASVLLVVQGVLYGLLLYLFFSFSGVLFIHPTSKPITDAPFKYYTSEYFTKLLLAAKPMTIWCFVQGAFGVTTALFCFVFPFACNKCGLPTVCVSSPPLALPPSPFAHFVSPPSLLQTITFSVLGFLSSAAMMSVNVVEVVKYGQNISSSWKIPAAVIGMPAAVCALFFILLITTSTTQCQVTRKRKFFAV